MHSDRDIHSGNTMHSDRDMLRGKIMRSDMTIKSRSWETVSVLSAVNALSCSAVFIAHHCTVTLFGRKSCEDNA